MLDNIPTEEPVITNLNEPNLTESNIIAGHYERTSKNRFIRFNIQYEINPLNNNI